MFEIVMRKSALKKQYDSAKNWNGWHLCQWCFVLNCLHHLTSVEYLKCVRPDMKGLSLSFAKYVFEPVILKFCACFHSLPVTGKLCNDDLLVVMRLNLLNNLTTVRAVS